MLRRALLILFAGLMLAVAAPARDVDIMTPFLQTGAMDMNSKILGQGIAFADGDRKKLDIYGPENPTGPAPIVMFIYGGSWKQGDKEGYEFVGRALAAQGFVVVIPDYRLYPEVTYPDFLTDNAQAVKWIQDNIGSYGGDTSRFFIAGHSAGAYNAVMLGIEKSFLREFNVTMPIKGIAAISGPYDFYPFEYDEVRNTFGNTDNPEGTQPVNLITSDQPPILLISGKSDPIVRVQNTEHLAEKLRASGDWVTEKYYDNVGHMEPVFAIGALWRWRAPTLTDMVDFFWQFGAFPSGTQRPVFTPEPPAGTTDIGTIVAELDTMFAPIGGQTALDEIMGQAPPTATTAPEAPEGMASDGSSSALSSSLEPVL